MPENTTGFLSNRVYNALKYFTLIVLPAIATLYFALGTLWDFPEVEKVLGSITSVSVFLGTLLGISSVQYNKNKYDGQIEVTKDERTGTKRFELILNDDPHDLDQKQTALFKIENK